MFGYKISISKLTRIETEQNTFSDYNWIKLENNNKYFCNILNYLEIKEHTSK